MSKITKGEALDRTFAMLVAEWRLLEIPYSFDPLRDDPPVGLGQNDHAIQALKNPVERVYFKDFGAKVTGLDLIKAKTVAELRDVIWGKIP